MDNIKEFKYIEMKSADIKKLKEKIWLQNEKKCPVLNIERPLEKMALDHAHKTKSEEYSETKGVIRTALDFRVNAVLGKLENSIKRTGLDKDENFDIVQFLKNAAKYFEEGAYKDENDFYYIHPSEVTKEPKISKKNYNKLKKIYMLSGAKKQFPEYPTSGKLTKPLKELFDKFQIEPFN